jgi:MerR family copper efflux transcriptional regulator
MDFFVLISEFAKAAKLPVDTVRFYVRLGLLKPETTAKGGSRPYAMFTSGDLDRAAKVRILQFLGYSLREIAPLVKADADGTLTAERSQQLLEEQLAKLVERRDHLDQMIAFVQARIGSLKDADGKAPDFDRYVSRSKHPSGLDVPLA